MSKMALNDQDEALSDELAGLLDDAPDVSSIEEVTAPTTPPAETPAEAAARERDELGRFAPKAPGEPVDATAKPATAPAGVTLDPAQQPGQGAAEPVAADLRPPPGWSPAAKVAFGSLPVEVQQAVARREVEVNAGFAKLAEYKPVERFAEMARQSGTTLDKALESYVGIEQTLRKDFVGGIAHICQRQGVDPVALAHVILNRAGLAPDQQGGGAVPQAGNQNPGFDIPPNHPLMQKLGKLEQFVETQQQQAERAQQTQIQEEIASFASNTKDYPFFENVRQQMGHLIKTGALTDILGRQATLKDAYDAACWSNQEIRSLLIKQQGAPATALQARAAAASQARRSAKSITGSPSPGSTTRQAETSIEDDVREAFYASSV